MDCKRLERTAVTASIWLIDNVDNDIADGNDEVIESDK